MRKARERLAVALREAGLSREAESPEPRQTPETALSVTCLPFQVNPDLKHNTL